MKREFKLMMSYVIQKSCLILGILLILLTNCQQYSNYNDGEIYSIKKNNGSSYNNISNYSYYIVKVLGTDSGRIFLCMYETRSQERPKKIDIDQYQECPEIHTKEDLSNQAKRGFTGFKIYSQEISLFREQEPILLSQIMVTEEEKKRISEYILKTE